MRNICTAGGVSGCWLRSTPLASSSITAAGSGSYSIVARGRSLWLVCGVHTKLGAGETLGLQGLMQALIIELFIAVQMEMASDIVIIRC